MLVVTGDYTLSKRFLEFVVSLRFVSSENNFTSLSLTNSDLGIWCTCVYKSILSLCRPCDVVLTYCTVILSLIFGQPEITCINC